MTEVHRENLSASMDGELTRDELRFLLRQLEHDVELRQLWGRYHVARDGLRQQLSPLASADFAERVLGAIEMPVAGSGRRGHWLRWSAGGAIAASVAVAALMGSHSSTDAGRAIVTGAAVNSDHAVAAAGMAVQQPTTPAVVPPWLSGNNASLYSQQASATLDGGYGDITLPYAQHLARYQVQRPIKVNPDGSYLLLIDQPSVPSRNVSPQAAAVAQ